MSFRVIFVVSDPKAPEEGKLVGDILYVRAPDGSENLVLKVKQMMSLVRGRPRQTRGRDLPLVDGAGE